MDIQNTRLVTAFNKTYPNIRVEVTRCGAEIIPRVEGEIKSRSEGADVFSHADPSWYVAQADKLLPAAGPASAGWAAKAWAVAGKSPLATGTPSSVFVRNTDIFPKGLKTWDDLLDHP